MFSAFEEFLVGTRAEFDRHAHLRGLEGSGNASQNLTVFYRELGWDDTAIKPFTPILTILSFSGTVSPTSPFAPMRRSSSSTRARI